MRCASNGAETATVRTAKAEITRATSSGPRRSGRRALLAISLWGKETRCICRLGTGSPRCGAAARVKSLQPSP
jgi:hypothetical protein